MIKLILIYAIIISLLFRWKCPECVASGVRPGDDQRQVPSHVQEFRALKEDKVGRPIDCLCKGTICQFFQIQAKVSTQNSTLRFCPNLYLRRNRKFNKTVT